MRKQEILSELVGLSQEGEIEILEKSADSVLIYDFQDGKEIIFNLNMNYKKLLNHIFISKRIPQEYRPHKQKLASYLIKHLPRDTFWTLNEICVLWCEEDYYEMVKRQELDDVNAWVEQLMDDEILGKMWFYKNTVIVNVRNILNSALDVEAEDIACGLVGNAYQDTLEQILITLVHELRHLMLDTNIVLSEEEYPVVLSAENEVEEFAREIVREYGWGVY